jgi:hypothetical protein
MAGANDEAGVQLHKLPPVEQVGRDTIARYRAQFRAIALHCLEILDPDSIDRVYCEYHDDFVSRKLDGGKNLYRFFQVKTVAKRNHQWSVAELFGIAKQRKNAKKPAADAADAEKGLAERIAKSFAGKLLHHTVKFGDACAGVSFLTNVNLDDEVELVVATIAEGSIASSALLAELSKRFNLAYEIGEPLSEVEIRERIQKLSFEPGLPYLNPDADDYEAKASQTIHKYSEINLTHTEGAEIARNLLGLVERKSFPKIVGAPTAEQLDKAAGIGLEDLLDLLSISKGGYNELLNGGDGKALKSVSIIQRKLERANASPSVIDTACKWKVGWDNWFRNYRHMYDGDMTFLLQDLGSVRDRWCRGEVSFSGLRAEASSLMGKWAASPLGRLLSRELIVGGILAELVRSESR